MPNQFKKQTAKTYKEESEEIKKAVSP